MGLGFRVYGLGFRVYLDPKSRKNHSPKPIITAIKAIILHTFGVQVGLRVEGLGLKVRFKVNTKLQTSIPNKFT